MPLQQTSGAASYDAFGGGAPVAAKYIEDFFQTWLRTGTGSSTTVTTGLNASINKSLVWTKSRSAATNHKLTDTARGVAKALSSNTTGAEVTDSQGLTAFSSTGYTIGTNTDYNNSGATYVDWQWVATPKFFDVVTWTGDGVVGRQISHALGSTPGCIIVKRTSSAADWLVHHRSLGFSQVLFLNTTEAVTGSGAIRGSTTTTFEVSDSSTVNANGATYVAYLFAHNAGGFGLTGTDNVISCGSYTGAGASTTVTLGYEPQWILIKRTNTTGPWHLQDVMRGATVSATDNGVLYPNTSQAEQQKGSHVFPTATGFAFTASEDDINASGSTYIYIAIRRGPMKVPESGTSVFAPVAYTGNGSANRAITTGFVPDMVWWKSRSNGTDWKDATLLIGTGRTLSQNTTDAEGSVSGYYINTYNNTGFTYGTSDASYNTSGWTYVVEGFSRAPSFFDVVCYTGTGSARTITHNLAAVPELMIVKCRSTARAWPVYAAPLGNTEEPRLNESSASGSSTSWNSTTPTSSVFSVSNGSIVNASGDTYVAYLFATCAGVSKVTTFTGNGSSQTINCGFTGGARFVLIKRVDSTGNWVTFDTARGISSGNDPALYLNSTAAEVTGVDAIDPDSTGFIVNQESTFNLNVSSATYLVLAIA